MQERDWTGDTNSIFKTLGATNHSNVSRPVNDYYATDPVALEKLLEVEGFSHHVWECAVGGGHLAKVLQRNGYAVHCSDIEDRGFEGTEIIDFLKYTPTTGRNAYDIVTNPPYKYAKEFVEHALDISMESVKVAMLLKIQFLEGAARQALFKKYPPKKIYVFYKRLECALNGNFTGASAVCYCWFIWEKGFTGKPTIDWI